MKILILEDADYDAELIEYELGKLKSLFHFRRAVTREQFLQALEEFSPDLILADYRLPAFDGLTALALAQEECPQVPFIFVSGAISPEMAEEGLRHGARDWISKDRLSRLPAAVQRSLQPAAPAAEPAASPQEDYHQVWADFVQHTRQMLVVLAADRTILEFNRGAELLCGCQRAEALGRDLVALLVEREKQGWAQAKLARVAADEALSDFELPIKCRSGAALRLHCRVSLLAGLPGRADILLLLAEELNHRFERPRSRAARTFTVANRPTLIS